MTCFVVLTIFCIAVFVISRIAADGPRVGSTHMRRAFGRLSERFGGELRLIGFRREPFVEFRYGRTFVRVTSPTEKGRVSTRAILQWSDASLQLEVVTRRAAGQLQGAADLMEIQIGDAAFQREFLVHSNDVAQAATILGESVRCQIDRLAHLFDDCPLRLTLSFGQLSVEKPVPTLRGDDLIQFTQLCLELYDQCMLTQVEGIEFVDEDVAQVVVAMICQVCGEAIGSDMVFCQRCRTPHHYDCWLYLGGCSTFGCQGKEYSVPSVANRVHPLAKDSQASTEDQKNGPDG